MAVARIRRRRQPARRRVSNLSTRTGGRRHAATPSLRTTSGNVFVADVRPSLSAVLRRRAPGSIARSLGNDEETAFLLNNGGGVKINIAGPLRARIDYRIFTLRGNPKHKNVQRIYAGSIWRSEGEEGRGHRGTIDCPSPSALLPLSAFSVYFE